MRHELLAPSCYPSPCRTATHWTEITILCLRFRTLLDQFPNKSKQMQTGGQRIFFCPVKRFKRHVVDVFCLQQNSNCKLDGATYPLQFSKLFMRENQQPSIPSNNVWHIFQHLTRRFYIAIHQTFYPTFWLAFYLTYIPTFHVTFDLALPVAVY